MISQSFTRCAMLRLLIDLGKHKKFLGAVGISVHLANRKAKLRDRRDFLRQSAPPRAFCFLEEWMEWIPWGLPCSVSCPSLGEFTKVD